MSQIEVNDQVQLTLPPSVVSRADLSRIIREAESVDNYLTTETARKKSGFSGGDQLVLSEQLTDLLSLNSLEFGDIQQRIGIINKLRRLKDSVPVVHMTFATTVDQEVLQKIVEWLRQSVHQYAVLSIGLQPDLIGGVYVRTTNQVHDMSLRSRLAEKRYLITEAVEAIRAGR